MTQSMSRFDPFAGLDSLRRELFDDGLLRGTREKLPTTDVYTNNDNELVVEAHLPHFKEDDITISVDRGSLVIQAERHEREDDKNKKYVMRESSSSFYRNIRLPEGAEMRDAEASFHEGVLAVKVPLRETTVPTKIPIASRHESE
ncbi:Hsp20/alpha crystallin family protein [Nesterenkonia natronophila]|uniref:Hsp20/alpha crystallin family protein n=1 Tax=Nesterenkonia natronophila TaxID=2174932 RepID=A0A3A4G3J7_9MICC|nr:Hsp20/alpha crystallin family protein [Nesterenkonia natronophila]RJN32869.1 Hsp20/alpha crystallin family protein [Nesterenkonia natronophila]